MEMINNEEKITRALLVSVDTGDYDAEASLDDVYGGAVEARRPAFLLRAAPGLLAPGSGPDLHHHILLFE